MKLAEALSLRAQLNNKITQLRSRINDCVKIQEGDNPSETPESAALLAHSGHRILYRTNRRINTRTPFAG